MLRFGFPELIVGAWLAMLSQLSRTVLVEGAVYGCSTAVTGIPEGDPLSVVGMFVLAKAFDHFVQKGVASVLCLTYADNWELVARSARELIRSIPVVERFLDLCHLLVSPAKCWFWAICPSGRRKLRASCLLQQRVPVKLQARELGADISYCHKKAARERNNRATSGLSRMSKLHSLPGSVHRKTRLLLSGNVRDLSARITCCGDFVCPAVCVAAFALWGGQCDRLQAQRSLCVDRLPFGHVSMR